MCNGAGFEWMTGLRPTERPQLLVTLSGALNTVHSQSLNVSATIELLGRWLPSHLVLSLGTWLWLLASLL